MREYPDNHGGIFNGGNDLQVAATLRTVFDINFENALEQARPAHARRLVCVLLGVFTWFVRRILPYNHLRAEITARVHLP